MPAAIEPAYAIAIPAAMHHGPAAWFAEVPDQFLSYVSDGHWPQRVSGELVTKYTLLANASRLS